MIFKCLLSAAIFIFLTGCNFEQDRSVVSMCNDQNRIDLPQAEGEWFNPDDTGQKKSLAFIVNRKAAVGEYQIDYYHAYTQELMKFDIVLCQVNNKIIATANNNNYWHNIIEISDDALSVATVYWDEKLLKNQKIPYEVNERQGFRFPFYEKNILSKNIKPEKLLNLVHSDIKGRVYIR